MSVYKPNPRGPIRDKSYPSEIAAQRPAFAPRLHCADELDDIIYNETASIRGGEDEDVVARVNRQLRER